MLKPVQAAMKSRRRHIATNIKFNTNKALLFFLNEILKNDLLMLKSKNGAGASKFWKDE